VRGRAPLRWLVRDRLCSHGPAPIVAVSSVSISAWYMVSAARATGTVLSGGVGSPAGAHPAPIGVSDLFALPGTTLRVGTVRGFVLAVAARCRRCMRCTPGPIGLFWLLDQCWSSHMPRTPVYRLWVVSGDGAIFVFLHGVSAIVARFLRNLRRISDGRRDAARSYRPDGSRAAYHLRHPHYRHPVLR